MRYRITLSLDRVEGVNVHDPLLYFRSNINMSIYTDLYLIRFHLPRAMNRFYPGRNDRVEASTLSLYTHITRKKRKEEIQINHCCGCFFAVTSGNSQTKDRILKAMDDEGKSAYKPPSVIQAYLGYCVTPSNSGLYPRIHG
jgi:hypothetical protein